MSDQNSHYLDQARNQGLPAHSAGQPGQTEQSLNGQQMAALQKQMADKLASVMKDVELRKWAVDQACSLAGSENPPLTDVVTLAGEIHRFLTAGAV